MSKINVWNATKHGVVLDDGSILDPARKAWVEEDSDRIKMLINTGEIINLGTPEAHAPVQQVQVFPIPSIVETEELSSKQSSKPKTSKSKRNVSEDTEASEENTVQLLSDSNNEVENEILSDSILPEDSE
jgi:hypothetical protein